MTINVYFKNLNKQLEPYRNAIKDHRMFRQMNSVNDLGAFVSNHIFAINDFLTLLHSCQHHFPNNSELKKMIDEFNSPIRVEDKTIPVITLLNNVIHELNGNKTVLEYINNQEDKLPQTSSGVKEYLNHTKTVLENNNTIELLGNLVFSRFDVISSELKKRLNNISNAENVKLPYTEAYLNRFCSFTTVIKWRNTLNTLLIGTCKNNIDNWEKCYDTAVDAYYGRMKLWDGTVENIKNRKRLQALA